MRVSRIKFQSFRSIKKCVLPFSSVTAVVGQNNVGKSALLRGLNAFFNFEKEAESYRSGSHNYSPNSQSRIEIRFDELTTAIRQLSLYRSDALDVRMSYVRKEVRPLYEYRVKGGAYQELPANILRRIKRQVQFVLIPPTRDTRALGWEETTLLRRLIDEHLSRTTAKRDRVSPKFRDAAGNLETKALKKLAKTLPSFYAGSHSLTFDVRFPDELTYSDFLTSLRFVVAEGKQRFSIEDCGTGIQSLLVIALHRQLAALTGTKIIIGIEEPETNLHPQAQRQLVDSFTEIIGQGPESQLIVTTHSPAVVDALDHLQVALVRKVADASRGFHSEIRCLPGNFWEKHKIEELKYYKFHKYRNSDFFFANLVVVVESSTDAEVVRLLMQQKNIDLDAYGVSVLNLDGVSNLKYPLALLQDLDIPYILIVDKDHFLPYQKGKLNASRDKNGFPKYKFRFKKNALLDKLVPGKGEQAELLKRFESNHSSAMNLLEGWGIICFKYALEVDLVASSEGARLLYDQFKVPPTKRTPRSLLVDRSDGLKAVSNLIPVVEGLPHKNLPNSYKRIKAVLARTVRDIVA